ncbi:MAG: homoaconitate hydratase [Bacteroidetes bacterium 4572_77]|nr:MAG: homoaconitate hydratase [Bacteroidetes bacterium 4572_77]
MNLIEKIIANHSKYDTVKPGDIVDIEIDARAARDFGGPNVVKNMEDNKLTLDDASKTLFTFDTNPTGSDQKYAINQQIVRIWARKNNVKIYDIDNGIGTHTMINEGIVYPGTTAVTTDSHANILGAIGAFGQGMGDQDIAAAFSRGKVWFKVPESVKLNFTGDLPKNVTPKDFVLNLLHIFGANKLLGYSIELYGEVIDNMNLSDRITIASMGTEMGAIILLFPPTDEIIAFSEKVSGKKIEKIVANKDAHYAQTHDIDVSDFKPMISNPGAPHDTSTIPVEKKIKIDSAFVGSCTNGRMEDMRAVAKVLKGRKIAPGVVLKIVPATDDVWTQCMEDGIFKTFKDAGALISNAGCAGCAAGQVGQNGPGEITVSTGEDKASTIEGRVWYIKEDNIDTDMIFHNRYLAITDMDEMGQYTFDNLEGYEDFSKKAKPGDIVIVAKNFGSGSSRQQAVDCFKSLGVQAIIAESFGAIYERNAINAAFPIMTYDTMEALQLADGDSIKVDFKNGIIENLTKSTQTQANPFSEVQLEIYQNGGLF